MGECDGAVRAVRRGLGAVVPVAALAILSADELERRVCGDAEVSCDELKAVVNYGSPYDADYPTIKYMWEALACFSPNERSDFLRFCTGRGRLPSGNFTLNIDHTSRRRRSWDGEDTTVNLPRSSTCSNALYLPEYESLEECAKMLKVAIDNCREIDND